MKQKSRIKIQLLTAILALSCLIGCSDSGKLSVQEFESIKSGFISPADTNKVWCYWYWLNDDISKEGVTKDLEAMKEAGIGGAFIGNINPDEVDGRVPLFSDQWWEIMVHAVNEGKRLGVDIGTFNCPGWSQSGGPWVKPEMAMRYLTYSETKVTGGAKIAVNLPKPHDLFQDVYVLAILHNESKYKTINQSGEKLFETNPQKSYSLEFAVPGTIKANTILLYPAKAQLKADCELFALQGGEYKLIKSFNYDRSNNSPSVGPDIYGPVAISIPGIESGNFRLICRNLTSNEAKAGFAEVIITEEILLEKYVEKQLGKMHPTPFPTWGTYLWDKQVNSNVPDKGIPESEIIDVSQFMDANGNLQWDAPAGKWAILRFGMTPT
ncbi:MAG: glycosyl hydrolase, partial [Bacteroidia bacterium]|nr:glycosyl hydrolase [Bacteroidia bacterium]